MAQQIKPLGSKPDDLSWIPGTHMLRKKTYSHKFFLACTTDTQTQKHKWLRHSLKLFFNARDGIVTDHYQFDKHYFIQDQKVYNRSPLHWNQHSTNMQICKSIWVHVPISYAYRHAFIYNIFPSYISFILLRGKRISQELSKSRLCNGKFRNTVTDYPNS